MPKKRKKNPGVGIDFKRAKLKVGKKLPQAKNATDTNFKAQSISLPGQSAFSDDRSGIPVTDRNLTIKVRLPVLHPAHLCPFPLMYNARHKDCTCLIRPACRLLQELLSQVGHYSERIRKDALSGLSQLLSAHPQVLRSQVLCLQERQSCVLGRPAVAPTHVKMCDCMTVLL